MLSYSGLVESQKEINSCILSIKNHSFIRRYLLLQVTNFLNSRKDSFSLKKEVTADSQQGKILSICEKSSMISYLGSLMDSQRCEPFKLEEQGVSNEI